MPWGSTSILVSNQRPGSLKTESESAGPSLNGFLRPLLPCLGPPFSRIHHTGLGSLRKTLQRQSRVALPREILFFKGHCLHRKSLRGGPTRRAPLSHGPDTPEANCDHTQQETHTIPSASESLVVTGSDKFSMLHRHTKANAK